MNVLKFISKIGKETVYLFALFGVLFIPFPFYLSAINLTIVQFLFERSTVFVSKLFLENQVINPAITSDSITLYVLILILFFVAFLSNILLSFWNKWELVQPKLILFIQTILAYYLALQLFKYGFDKIFKTQFYLPEPNTLFTPLGLITKDLAYWSTIGISYSYNIFMGIFELIPALLLLFRKTRILGAFIGLAVLSNIVAINFGFDISVKIFSMFLWLVALLILLPYLFKIYQFFVQQISISIAWQPLFQQKTYWLLVTKIFIIGIMILEVFSPFIEQQNFNDDRQNRPYLHGAYDVQNDAIIKRFFIHRKGYIIFQNRNDEFTDYKLSIDIIQQEMTFTDYGLNTSIHPFQVDEKNLQILTIHLTDSTALTGRSIDWKQLPLLKNDFHWSVD